MNKYKKEIAERRKCGSEMEIKKLPEKRRGHPLLLGEAIDRPLGKQVLLSILPLLWLLLRESSKIMTATC